jgi:hypothetical protein
VWTDQIVLGLVIQLVLVRPSRDRIDAADGDLHRVRFPVGGVESQPQGLPLVHGDEHVVPIDHIRLERLGESAHREDRKESQAGRQRVDLAVFRYAQGSLQGDEAPFSDLDSVVGDGDWEIRLDHHGLRFSTASVRRVK